MLLLLLLLIDINVYFSVYTVCIRCVHDSQLSPACQSMYAKLMMNLSEPLVAADKSERRETARTTLIKALGALVEKTHTIAVFYLPALVAAIERGKREAAANAASTSAVVSSTQKATSSGESATQRPALQPPTAVQKPPMDIKEVRHMIKQLLQSVKLIAHALTKTTADERKYLVV